MKSHPSGPLVGMILILTTFGNPAQAKESAVGTVHTHTNVSHVHLKFNHVRTGHVRFGHFRFGKLPNNPPPSTPTPPPAGPTVNAISFGAKGDGKTDNWQAFHNALLAAPNGTLYIPAGTYLCSAPVSLNSQNITGDGPTSVVEGTFSQFKGGVITASGNCTISNIAVTLDASHATGTHGIYANGTSGPITINQVTLVGPFWFNVYLTSSSGITLENCTIANTSQPAAGGPGGIEIDNCYTVLIASNNFTALNASPVLDMIQSFSFANGGPTQNLTIASNVFQGQNLQGYGIYLTNVSGLNITGNYFSYPMYQGNPNGYQGTPGGVALVGSAPGLNTGFGPIVNAQITNNAFVDIQPLLNNVPQNAPILITAQGQSSVQNVVVNGNSMSQYPGGSFGCSLDCGIYAGGTNPGDLQNFSASSNDMTGIAYAGIFVDDTNGVSMTNNAIANSYGLGVFSGQNNGGSLTISNNVFTNCGIAPPTSSAVKYLGLSTQAVIDVQAAANVTSANINNNSYGTASEANNLQYYMYTALSKTITDESGDVDATMLPNFGPQ